MFCSECGNVVDEGVVFCPGCGAKVADTKAVSTGSVSNAKGEKTMEQKNGFFASLFDFSFSQFITTKIIKVLFGIGVVAAVLGAGAATILPVIKGYSSLGAGKILALIILSPLLALLYIIIIRVWLEIIIVMFRIAEHIGEIAMQGRRKS